jgi:hypothetical protein
LDQTLAAYGFILADLESWSSSLRLTGGTYGARRLNALRDGTIDAIFDEGIVSWFDEALTEDMQPVLLYEFTFKKLETLVWRRAIIPAGRFPHLKSDHPCGAIPTS